MCPIILNAVESLHLDETTGNVFTELLHATIITNSIDISDKYRLPIEHLLHGWNYVTVQDSPKHILNALNDDCIQKI